jgi:hypothetical protein
VTGWDWVVLVFMVLYVVSAFVNWRLVYWQRKLIAAQEEQIKALQEDYDLAMGLVWKHMPRPS